MKNRSKNEAVTYALQKLVQLLLALFVLSSLVFFVSRLCPGEPLRAFYGDGVERMSLTQLSMAREKLGLSDSLPEQYGRWLSGALQGDFGISFQYKQEVPEVIKSVYMNTVVLTAVSFVIILVGGLLLAVFCVRHEDRFIDRLICRTGIALNSIPEFFTALVLVMIFAVELALLPSGGTHTVGQTGNLADRLVHLILPVSAVVISHLWYCAYLMRNKLAEEVRKEYVLLCRGKGLSERRILYGHCLKNIMPGVVSIMAVFLPHLLGGAYVVEMIFSCPGLGTLGFESARYHDYNMLMVICLLTGAVVISANMLAQIINERLDPRTQYEEGIGTCGENESGKRWRR